MGLFVIAAGIMAVLHLVLASERPRLAIFVSGALWLLYAVYEYQVATGVLCDATATFASILCSSFPFWGSPPTAPTRPTMGSPAR